MPIKSSCSFSEAMKTYPLEEQLGIVTGLLGAEVAEKILEVVENDPWEEEERR